MKRENHRALRMSMSALLFAILCFAVSATINASDDPNNGMQGQQYTVVYDNNSQGEQVTWLADNNSGQRWIISDLLAAYGEVPESSSDGTMNGPRYSVVYDIDASGEMIPWLLDHLKENRYRVSDLLETYHTGTNASPADNDLSSQNPGNHSYGSEYSIVYDLNNALVLVPWLQDNATRNRLEVKELIEAYNDAPMNTQKLEEMEKTVQRLEDASLEWESKATEAEKGKGTWRMIAIILAVISVLLAGITVMTMISKKKVAKKRA